MQRYKCAKMKLELGKGHTANGWQTLNLNPHLFTEKTVNVPQSLQKHQRGKRGARALDGKVNQWKGSRWAGPEPVHRPVGYFGCFPQTGSAAVMPPTPQPEPARWRRPGCDGSRDSPDAVLLCSDEPWSRKSPSEDRRPGPQPCSSPRPLWFLRARGRLPWESSREDKLTPVSLPCGVSLRGIYARALRKTKFCGKFWAKQRFMVMGWVVPQRKGIPPGKGPLPGPVESLLLFSEWMKGWTSPWLAVVPSYWRMANPPPPGPHPTERHHGTLARPSSSPILPTPAYRSFTTVVYTS